MARKPVITRTIKSTRVCVLAVDTVQESLVDFDLILPRTYKDEQAIIKAIKKLGLLPDHLVVTRVKEVEECEKRYSMPEEKFAELADVIEE